MEKLGPGQKIYIVKGGLSLSVCLIWAVKGHLNRKLFDMQYTYAAAWHKPEHIVRIHI